MRFAGRNFAVPLGARQPVLMSSLNAERFENWSQYDQWVQKEAAGKASEPLASGWAAAMFLWRAAATTQGTWLFGRENLEPVLKDESYVDVLHQMQQTATRYPSGRLSPEEIWASLSKGNLKVAIGFPFGQITDGLSLSDLPSEYDPPRVLLDLFTPVVSISNGCRQSAAAKKFIAWLCGGDGSENLRRQIPSMTITRSPRLTNESNASTEQDGDYDAWLRNRLKTTMTLPVIQLNAATEYYRVLDEQVGRCLDGKAKPAEALNDTAKQWQEITQTQGVEIQMRQWRRCQGMRA